MRKDLFLAKAEELVGSPFRYRGRCPDKGLDCAGVPVLCFAAAGSETEFPSEYTRFEEQALLIDWVNKVAEQVFEPPQPGDLILLKYGVRLQHVAVVVSDNAMVHAFHGAQKVVKSTIDYSKLAAVYRPFWSD